MTLFLIFIGGIGLLITLTIIRTRQLKNIYNNEIKYSNSKVVDKYQSNKIRTVSKIYYVKFEIDKGRNITLEVPEGVYGIIDLNNEGELAYSGKNFLRFDKK